MVKSVKSQRPVNLDISTFKFTPQMIASITHRIAGVGIFVGIAFLIWGLGMSLHSQESFEQLRECLDSVLERPELNERERLRELVRNRRPRR